MWSVWLRSVETMYECTDYYEAINRENKLFTLCIHGKELVSIGRIKSDFTLALGSPPVSLKNR